MFSVVFGKRPESTSKTSNLISPNKRRIDLELAEIMKKTRASANPFRSGLGELVILELSALAD